MMTSDTGAGASGRRTTVLIEPDIWREIRAEQARRETNDSEDATLRAIVNDALSWYFRGITR